MKVEYRLHDTSGACTGSLITDAAALPVIGEPLAFDGWYVDFLFDPRPPNRVSTLSQNGTLIATVNGSFPDGSTRHSRFLVTDVAPGLNCPACHASVDLPVVTLRLQP